MIIISNLINKILKMNYVDSNAVACKVVLLGESGVGKTSIISRYVKNIFSSNELPTPGASFASKIMYFNDFNKNVKFDV
jgi:GTPase SAR1 family protein